MHGELVIGERFGKASTVDQRTRPAANLHEVVALEGEAEVARDWRLGVGCRIPIYTEQISSTEVSDTADEVVQIGEEVEHEVGIHDVRPVVIHDFSDDGPAQARVQ